MAKILFLIACAAALFAPFVSNRAAAPHGESIAFRGFPIEFEGVALKELGLTEREKFFLEDFPGKIGRYTDGRREIIFRWVTKPTRKMHPAADCFKAIGFETKPLPLKVDAAGKHWACFSARKNGESLRVCERIYNGAEEEWTDVSAWYWTALSSSSGEWWAVTVAERE